MKRICTICARSGSKGVKNKNIRHLMGIPLLVYSLEQAIASRLFDTIAVSSDSEEILKVAKSSGAQYGVMRPAELASDTAPKLPAIRHCVESIEKSGGGHDYDVVVDLDVTSPLRTPQDIVACVELLEKDSAAGNVITVTESRRSPYFNMVELSDSGEVRLCKKLDKPVYRRQDAPKTYDLNASIYAWRRDSLRDSDVLISNRTRLYIMPEERSWDIDTEMDFFIVESMLKASKGYLSDGK